MIMTLTYWSKTWTQNRRQITEIQAVTVIYLSCGMKRTDGEVNEGLYRRFSTSIKDEGMSCGAVEMMNHIVQRWILAPGWKQHNEKTIQGWNRCDSWPKSWIWLYNSLVSCHQLIKADFWHKHNVQQTFTMWFLCTDLIIHRLKTWIFIMQTIWKSAPTGSFSIWNSHIVTFPPACLPASLTLYLPLQHEDVGIHFFCESKKLNPTFFS